MIEAIWPSFATWQMDALPISADINPQGLLSFSLYWLVSIPFLFIKMPNLRWMFLVKMCIVPFLGVSLFTWAAITTAVSASSSQSRFQIRSTVISNPHP